MTPKFFTKAPTLYDIALGLSTIPRWNGRTILDRVGMRWSVLQHTLACMAYAARDTAEVQWYIGVHDCEEMLSGDTPKPFKTREQSYQGDMIREEIIRGLGMPKARTGVVEIIKRVDEDVRCAEACTLLHPGELIRVPGYQNGFRIEAADQVWGLLDIPVRTAIELYVDKMEQLADDSTVKALRRLV
ncbi:MAG: hypothetical protein AB7R40_23155 [Nitrospiraceae bacterium]